MPTRLAPSVRRGTPRPTCPGSGRAARTPLRALRRGSRLLLADRRGVAAVEFAMLAAPILMLLCVILEAGLVTLSQQTLDVSVDRAVRQLRTGGFQDAADGSDPVARLRKVMCGGSVVLFRCDSLRLDMTRAPSFTTSQVTPPYDAQKQTWNSGFGTHFDCPQGNDVVALSGAAAVPRLFGFLDSTKRRMVDGSQLMVSTFVFRTEAYTGKGCR